MSEEKLKMSFEPTVIEHLGVKMYSHTVPAIAELIAMPTMHVLRKWKLGYSTNQSIKSLLR